jgi:hypothetical protein
MRASLALFATAVLLAAATLTACGHEDSPSRTSARPAQDEQEREARERREQLRSIPAQDRVAYYQLATTIGLLRARLIPGARRKLATIRSAAGPVGALAPRDRTLRRARDRLLAVLRREDTDAVLAAATDVDGELAVYARRHPAVAVLVPD